MLILTVLLSVRGALRLRGGFVVDGSVASRPSRAADRRTVVLLDVVVGYAASFRFLIHLVVGGVGVA